MQPFNTGWYPAVPNGAERLRGLVLECYLGAFRYVLWRPPCASAANESPSETRSGDRASAAESALAEEECVVQGAF